MNNSPYAKWQTSQMDPLTPFLLSRLEICDPPLETMNLNTNQRFFLSSSKDIWIVESGRGDIFSLERVQNKNEGPLTHISSIETGALIFCFPETQASEHITYLFIASKNVRLKKLNVPLLQRLIKDFPEISTEIAASLTKWINSFSFLFNEEPPPISDEPQADNSVIFLQKDESFFPPYSPTPEHKHDIVWVKIVSGQAAIINLKDLILSPQNEIYPLTSTTWLKALEPTEATLSGTEKTLLASDLWEGIFLFQTHVLELSRQRTEAVKAAIVKKIALKEELENALLHQSFDHMASVLTHEEKYAGTSSDALLRAIQMLGAAMGIAFTEPAIKQVKGNARSMIAEICRASQVRFRKVLLESHWWKSDSGPLLGFYGKDERPVVLIRNRSGNYLVADPFTKDQIPITEKIDEELSRTAYVFYQPFPEGKLSGLAIIKFCLKDRWKEIIAIIGAGALGAILSLFPPLANQLLFNKVIKGGEQLLFPEIIIGLVVIAISTTIFIITRSYATLRLGQMIDSKLESALWDRILNLPATFFRKYTSGNLIQRIYAVSEMHQMLTGNALKVILSGIFSAFYFIAMIYYSGTLALLGLSVIGIALLISITCIGIKTHLQRKILEVNGNLNGTLIQLIQGVSKLRVAGAENRAFSYWSNQFTESKRLQFKSQTIQNLVTVTTSILPILSSAVLFTAVINMLRNGTTVLNVGTIIAFLAAYAPFSQAIFDTINTVINLVSVVPLWERAKVILQAEPEITKEKERLDDFKGKVSLDHICFRYEKESPEILSDLSLHANPGEFIAIVGPSGCGKSTIVRLLLGFETAEKGTVYYDEKDISSLDLKELRRKIGTVLQNGAIFSGSIHENIACGGAYNFSQIEQALELSGFGEDLKNLPMGLHTVVQSGGGTLSGGQAQRLLIARALITQPKVLIFDEATSALDTKTQELISHNLDKINVTRIVIAHRLSTIKNADRIYVLEKGKVLDAGTFAELSQREGLFKQMLIRQTL